MNFVFYLTHDTIYLVITNITNMAEITRSYRSSEGYDEQLSTESNLNYFSCTHRKAYLQLKDKQLFYKYFVDFYENAKLKDTIS